MFSAENSAINQSINQSINQFKKLSLISLMLFVSFGAIAQLQVNSSGNVGIGTSPFFNFDIYKQISVFHWGSSLNIDCGPIDPRLWGNYNNKVVFYNTNSQNFCDIEYRTAYANSDEKSKCDIKIITNALDLITKVQGVSYKWKAEKDNSKKQLGFIAQDIEGIIPEATIKNDSTGEFLISYDAFIPLLVESLKEQQKQISELKDELSSVKQADIEKSVNLNVNAPDLNTLAPQQATLSQNIPNPFTVSSRIDIYLPQSVGKAALYVYNMQGNQIKAFNVTERGNTAVTIEGSSLKAGMYLYTLVADGKEVDTKKMILTK